MKIYIVTSGCYSDYGIDAVFLSKEKAEFYAKHCAIKEDYPEVEEYETSDNDIIVEEKVINYFSIKMDNHGEIISIEPKTYKYTPYDEEFKEEFYYRSPYFFGRLAIDTEEKAIKSMQDRRAEWLACKFGVY